MNWLVACRRAYRVLAHVLQGVWTVRREFPRLTSTQKEERIQAWALELLARLAIKLVVKGQPSTAGPVLLVANHISWLDIVVMHAARHCRFISKDDVRHWPLVGILATGADTLYLQRGSSRDAMRVVHQMRQSLVQGDVLAVFPEGTTGDGVQVLPFHGNLLQAAISCDVPAQPVALQFIDAATGAASFAPCYVGTDTLVRSVWRTLCARGVVAEVRFGPPQWASGRERRIWANDLRLAVQTLRGDPGVVCE